MEVRRGEEAEANGRSDHRGTDGRSHHRGTGERAANLVTRRPVVTLGGFKTVRDALCSVQDTVRIFEECTRAFWTL